LGGIEDVANSQSLISAEQDEDYETDATVMRNTKKLCKRDLLETYRLLQTDQKEVEK
jgi:hypothetical protein